MTMNHPKGMQTPIDLGLAHSSLRARRMGIHSLQEALVFMRTDCHVCLSEGLSSHSRVLLKTDGHEIIATLYQVRPELLADGEAGLSEAAWLRLGLAEGAMVRISHPQPVDSLSDVRKRIYGHRLDDGGFRSIISDIVAGAYSDVQISSFITACAAFPLDEGETVSLTRVMVDVGERLTWDNAIVLDKHSVGGLPGNRTTPIVVAIVAAHGLTMPKTSSRAITSPAGTADTMETMAPVDLDIAMIRRVVEKESGCIAWGGAVRLSPADDILIQVERALDIDSEGQLVASVLSKKIAAGSNRLVLDVPVGSTAKVRTAQDAKVLASRLSDVASVFGLSTMIIVSDGSQPVGRGIGPALEARDVLSVLQRSPAAPEDLRQRACVLAGALLEMAGAVQTGQGAFIAAQTIDDGRAWKKFQAICEAQGGMRTPPMAKQTQPILASKAGYVDSIDNRRIARLAKLAGAPGSKAAGVQMHVRLGDKTIPGQPLCTVHADNTGELNYALGYASANTNIIRIAPK